MRNTRKLERAKVHASVITLGVVCSFVGTILTFTAVFQPDHCTLGATTQLYMLPAGLFPNWCMQSSSTSMRAMTVVNTSAREF